MAGIRSNHSKLWLPEDIEKLERETGVEPATSSLGIWLSIVNKRLRRQWRGFLVKTVYCCQAALLKCLLSEVTKVTPRAAGSVQRDDDRAARASGFATIA